MTCELSVVIPAYQEADHLRTSITMLLTYLTSATPDWEVVIVDDGSEDGTWAEICALHAESPRIRGLRLSRNFGKEKALSAGLEIAAGKAVIIIDADLQHPPNLIPVFYSLWKQGRAEIINGVKRIRDDEPLLRRGASRVFSRFAGWSTGINFENASDFKLLDRRVLDAWKTLPEKRPFFRGMVNWVGFHSEQVEFDVLARRSGRSRWTLISLASLAWNAITSYSAMPLRLIFAIAAAFFVFAAALACRTLYLYCSGTAVTGFTTVIMLVLLLGGIILVCLGIIAEYIAAIYEELKGRPRYLVADKTPE